MHLITYTEVMIQWHAQTYQQGQEWRSTMELPETLHYGSSRASAVNPLHANSTDYMVTFIRNNTCNKYSRNKRHTFLVVILFSYLSYKIILSNYTRRIQSQFQPRPLVTSCKVSTAEVTDWRRWFFRFELWPTFYFYVTVLTRTF